MSADYSAARAIAQYVVGNARDNNNGVLTTEIIAREVDSILKFRPEWQNTVDRVALIKELETMFQTWIGEARTLYDDLNHERWMLSKKGQIDWKYWSRYQQYLYQQGWARETVQKLDQITDDLMDLLEFPGRKGHWDRRGVVVGHVQSGKTANYTGLVCKAADAGYKLIVVLAGLYTNLRSQTQQRLDEGFLGYDSASLRKGTGQVKPVGVGLMDFSPKRPDTITTRLENGDFNRTVANSFNISPGGNSLLFVVKKNSSVLRNLLEWVEWAANSTDAEGKPYVRDVPLLVIDDEADHASVDTKVILFDENGVPDPDHDPTKINQSIRRLLHRFEQSAYVGYTATPFANIFIHEMAKTHDHGEDLFPRSFIMALPVPSNYVGPLRVFGMDNEDDPEGPQVDGLPIKRKVIDHALSLDPKERQGWMPPRHNKLHIPLYDDADQVPPSLREAICAFVLVCAARRARNQRNVHNSMLVHVSRYVDVQKRVHQQVSREVVGILNRLKRGEGESTDPVIEYLRRLWEKDFLPTTNSIGDPDCSIISWDDITKHLLPAVSAINVRLINGSAKDVLDYHEHQSTGLSTIAIGGDRLSRGLTLEGLSVSYFLRASKMYDTLMQMGRWFGYRHGYLDLCRLYTTPDLKEWFRHITAANEELRKEFDHMCAVRQTPRDYGLRVRSHSSLLVTSRVKMRHGRSLQLSFSGDISETVVFYRDEDHIQRNHAATVRLINGLEAEGANRETSPVRSFGGRVRKWNNAVCWQGASSDSIRRFLDEYTTHPAAYKVNCRLLSEYVQKQNIDGNLTTWTVLLLSGQGSTDDSLSVTINLAKRQWHSDQGKLPDRYVIRRLVSPIDEAIDLSEAAFEAALRETRDAFEAGYGKSKRLTPPEIPGGIAIRRNRQPQHGLLLIYPLDPEDKSEKGQEGLPIVGFAVSFPRIENDRTVTYVVNNVYFDQEVGLVE